MATPKVEKEAAETGPNSVVGGSVDKLEDKNELDQAYQFFKEHHVEPLSEGDNRRILRKVDWHLLPLVSRATFLRYAAESIANSFFLDGYYLYTQLHGQKRPILLGQFWPN